MRTEKDFLGELQLPNDALYGIHSARAVENFMDQTPFSYEWYKAVGIVKLACYQTYQKFKSAAKDKFEEEILPIRFFDDKIIDALSTSASELSNGNYFNHFIVPAIQGGAGTSINMNVNEIIANAALQQLNQPIGNYSVIDPFEQANVFQSTNDVIPTALTVAAMHLLNTLEDAINKLRQKVEQQESRFRNVLRQGYTQMQAAVPSTYDKLFSSYNNALSRDWWRVSKCLERIKEVNLGGGAIGTGISIPRFFIMQVVSELQHLTGLPLTRSENLNDATANLDRFVEVHATMKAHAVNLEKMVNDLRLMSSDLFTTRELSIPQRQLGSSIMPGKVNPVIPEFVISAVHKVYANDQMIAALCGQGCLELNAYLPSIGHALLESLKLLINCNTTLRKHLFDNLSIVSANDKNHPCYLNPAITTALTPYVGYHQAAQLAKLMKDEQISIFEANLLMKLISSNKLDELMKPESLIRQGYSLNDLK
ncbi:aspartate ammonia-lyase [Carboxylicivirga mesophila]|uniref:Aspartate ammonia-lyase n=1 Tax=Carboxylicivirga mesophila TaxID=1166478 RepID=A0ABS5KAX7_9BACT|nr:lyase family protein [Carboxylicivirga mesophila]MBS2211658.1 aspartate ammonia-lyase [Carboxylicivirga mesophila]